MYNFRSRAAVSLLEHGFVDDQGRFDVLRGRPHVPPYPVQGLGEEARMAVHPPFDVRVGAALVCFRTSLKDDMWMFLLKKSEEAVQSHYVPSSHYYKKNRT